MANIIATSRTNYFRVTNEERYNHLFENLTAEYGVEDFTKVDDNGVLWHGFGAYDSIDYRTSVEIENEEGESITETGYDFDEFLDEIQKILPDDEAFMYFEINHEKLRYVSGFACVVTSKEIKSFDLNNWAFSQARELLGEDFHTITET